MQRVFTRDVGHYKAGEIRDWPKGTWEGFNLPIDSFSRTLEEAARAGAAADSKTKAKEKTHA